MSNGVGVFKWLAAFRSTDKARPLTVTTVAVGYALATFANYSTGENARPVQDTLAAATGAHVRTVGRALETLESLGWTSTMATMGNGVKVYRLTLPPGLTPGERDAESIRDRVHPGLTPDAPRSDAGHPPASRRTTSVLTSALKSSNTYTAARPDPWEQIEAEEREAQRNGAALGLTAAEAVAYAAFLRSL